MLISSTNDEQQDFIITLPDLEMILLYIMCQGLNFYTYVKTVSQLWRSEDATSSQTLTNMPTMR